MGPSIVVAQETGTRSGELTRGEPEIDVLLPEPEVTTGAEQTLELQLHNEGDLKLGTQRGRVLTARGVTVEIIDGGPFDVKSGASSTGSLPDGQLTTVAQRVAVPDDIEPGEYEITVEVSYSYTRQVSDGSQTAQQRSGSERVDLTVEVPDEPRFELGTAETDVQPGADGSATLAVENVGSETARQARATVAGTGGVTVDGGTAEEVLGNLEPGDTEQLTVDIDIAETTSEGSKPLEVTVSYRDSSGIKRSAPPEMTSLVPASKQSFSIRNLDETLSVGYEGEITGKIVNDGPRPVDDAVLVVEPMSESLFVEDTRYALPALKQGEATEFRYPTDVSGQADAGARQLRFTVEYTGSGDATLTDGPISERVVVDERRDEFSIADDGISVSQGESSDAVLEITNQRSETLSNIDAKLYADDPLDAPDGEAFVNKLEPGESAEIRFELEATEDATVETHPVELDFEYETERGESILSDTYQHPIEVTASEDDGGGVPSVVVGILVALAVSTIGIALWYRQD
ncbi:hypothetical protein NP511_16065 [Natrinema thermotolerans]|uniref:Uncharacterized protein n=2 Tax=Natrinema thermotolerans TaxID=121872 RepID=A0AAF0T107_9EURY|nr:hypothetical protein [Natrinema thermotolerans]WMT10201.1 hypothetical protein NP511_16065 [Natrinema thermotolerans]